MLLLLATTMMVRRRLIYERPLCLSVTRWYWLKTNDRMITQFSLLDRQTLVFWHQLLPITLGKPIERGNPIERRSYESGWVKAATKRRFSTNKSLSRKRQKVDIELRWETNRKSHVSFWLVPILMTLNDLNDRMHHHSGPISAAGCVEVNEDCQVSGHVCSV